MTNNTQTVVVVEGEELLVSDIESLMALGTEYNVQTFSSPRAALSYIKKCDVDLVISGYLMPQMDGISFLAQVREIRPEASRTILTGCANKENAIRAINEAGLVHYFEKPLDHDDLRIVVRNALKRKELLDKLQEKMSEMSHVCCELADLQERIVKVVFAGPRLGMGLRL